MIYDIFKKLRSMSKKHGAALVSIGHDLENLEIWFSKNVSAEEYQKFVSISNDETQLNESLRKSEIVLNRLIDLTEVNNSNEASADLVLLAKSILLLKFAAAKSLGLVLEEHDRADNPELVQTELRLTLGAVDEAEKRVDHLYSKYIG